MTLLWRTIFLVRLAVDLAGPSHSHNGLVAYYFSFFCDTLDHVRVSRPYFREVSQTRTYVLQS